MSKQLWDLIGALPEAWSESPGPCDWSWGGRNPQTTLGRGWRCLQPTLSRAPGAAQQSWSKWTFCSEHLLGGPLTKWAHSFGNNTKGKSRRKKNWNAVTFLSKKFCSFSRQQGKQLPNTYVRDDCQYKDRYCKLLAICLPKYVCHFLSLSLSLTKHMLRISRTSLTCNCEKTDDNCETNNGPRWWFLLLPTHSSSCHGWRRR